MASRPYHLRHGHVPLILVAKTLAQVGVGGSQVQVKAPSIIALLFVRLQ